jgi:hypothetical protein
LLVRVIWDKKSHFWDIVIPLKWPIKILTDFDRIKVILKNNKGKEGTKKDRER